MIKTAAYYLTLVYITISCVYCLLGILPSPLASKLLPQYATVAPGRLQNASAAWQSSNIYWSPSSSALYSNNGRRRLATPESLFLSKAFDHSMRPSQVIPFYFRARGPDGTGTLLYNDITILTIVTSNRFSVLGKLAQRYGGPISVAIHVTETPTSHRDAILNELQDLYQSTPGMSTWVDVHLILDSFDRQFNMWRNAARLFARTEFVMMLDVDFAVCTDFRRRLLDDKGMLEKVRVGDTALVVPAFEYVELADGRDEASFPRSKEELTALWKEDKIKVFHDAWEGGHNSSDYSRYFEAAPGDVYKVLAYQHAYEPYVIFKRDGPPWCDERFIGYGGNKASCLYEMFLAGISFFVLSDDFLIHQSHQYAEDVRKAERRYNRQLYTEFRTEACIRSLHRCIVMKELTSPRGLNVQSECQKIRGVSALAIEASALRLSPSPSHLTFSQLINALA